MSLFENMSLNAWAVRLLSRMAPSVGTGRASSSCPGRAVGANVRTANDASRLAVALIRGVAGIPSGPDRARECAVRRAEIASGIRLVLRSLEASARALRAQSHAGGGRLPPQLLRELAKRLRWAASAANAFQTASRTLQTLDSCGGLEPEYLQLAEDLNLIKKTLQDFLAVVGDLDEAAPGQPPVKHVAAAPHAPQAEKLEALSETCSTSSGEGSGWCPESCSESGEESSEERETEAEAEESPLAMFWYDGLYWG